MMPSNFEFLSKKAKNYSQKYIMQEIEGSFIDIPDDWPFNLNETEICFIQESNYEVITEKNFNHMKYINMQFVLLKSIVFKEKKQDDNRRTSFLIYSLENNQEPLVKFLNGEFEDFTKSFFSINQDNQVIFTLKGNHVVYEIIYDKKYGIVSAESKNTETYELKNDERIKFEICEDTKKRQNSKFSEFNPVQNEVIPQEIEISMNNTLFNDTFTQYYYVENNGNIQLIYPYHFQTHSLVEDHHFNINDEKQINQKQEMVKTYIQQKIGFLQSQSLNISIHFNQTQIEIFQLKHDFINYLEEEGKPKNDIIQVLYCSKNVIICICKNFNKNHSKKGVVPILHSFSIKNSRFHDNFDIQYKRILSHKTSSFNMLHNILQNFEWQQNYNKLQQINLFDSSQQNLTEISDNYYMNKKKGIYLTQNKIIIDEKEYQFSKRNLIIDCSEFEQNDLNTIKLLKLYSEDITDVRLLKYHISNQCIIFFFEKKSKKALIQSDNLFAKAIDQVQNLSFGIEFFIIKTINQIQKMIYSNSPLLSKDINVFIPYQLTNIQKCKFQEMLDPNNYSEMLKIMDVSTHKLTFETVSDQNNPTKEWFPFIFHNKVASSKFDHYFCFINIDIVSDQLFYQDQNDLDDQIDFSECLQVFKIDYYQKEDEPFKYQQCKNNDSSYRNHNYSSKVGGISLFSRSSNWQRQKYLENIEDSIFSNQNDTYSFISRFQIGVNFIFDDIQLIEIQEFLVTINRNKIYFNRDQSIFKPIQESEKNMANSQIQILPIQQRFVLKSQYYVDYQKQKQKNFFEKERIIPKINDQGQIEGTLLIINQSQTFQGIFQITDNIQVIQKYCKPELKHELLKRAGEYVYVKNKDANTFSGYFSDGYYLHGIEYDIVEEFAQQALMNMKNGQTILKRDQLCKKLKNTNHQHYWYNIIELSDNYNKDDLLQPIVGPFTRQSVKQMSFNNQLNNQIIMCSTLFTKNIIANQYFNKDESIYWLYYFQRFLLCMSLPNFKELLFENNRKRIQMYFQPRYVLTGKSFSHIDLQYNVTSIQNLKAGTMYKIEPQNQYVYLENSPMFYSLLNSKLKKQNNIIKCLHFGKFYKLQYNYLIHESIVQKAIDQHKLQAVSFIVEYIFKNSDEEELSNILTQDLPQLLGSAKVDIGEYLDISYQEEKEMDNMNNLNKFGISQNLQKKFFFNLEQQISLEELPNFGSSESKVIFIDYDEPFFSQKIISETINSQNEAKKQDLDKNNENENIENEEQTDGQVQIHFSFIDFSPMIRKMKIDKLLGREACESQGTKYLDLLTDDCKEINYVDEFLISSIINVGAEMNTSVIDKSTVRRIITLQYVRVRPLIKMQMLFYIFCFCFPFIYNIYQFGDNHDEQRKHVNYYIIYMNYLICLICQVVLVVFELADIKFNGFLDYISDGWNIFDSSQFVAFLVHVYIRYQHPKIVHGIFKLADNLIQIMIVLQSSVKILQFLRYNEDFCFLVSMITHVLLELIPFFTIFAMYILVFTIINIVMEADFDDSDYQDVPRFLRIFIQTFRNSIGDIQVQNYGQWSNKQDDLGYTSARPIAIFIIWIFWFINIILMLVILINFLISQVGNTYKTVTDQGDQFLFLQKAELNQHIFTIEEMFGIKQKFKIMVFQQQREEFKSKQQDEKFDLIKYMIEENYNQIIEIKKEMTKIQSNINSDVSDKLDMVLQSFKGLYKQQIEEKEYFGIQFQNLQQQIENIKINQQKGSNLIEKQIQQEYENDGNLSLIQSNIRLETENKKNQNFDLQRNPRENLMNQQLSQIEKPTINQQFNLIKKDLNKTQGLKMQQNYFEEDRKQIEDLKKEKKIRNISQQKQQLEQDLDNINSNLINTNIQSFNSSMQLIRELDESEQSIQQNKFLQTQIIDQNKINKSHFYNYSDLKNNSQKIGPILFNRLDFDNNNLTSSNFYSQNKKYNINQDQTVLSPSRYQQNANESQNTQKQKLKIKLKNFHLSSKQIYGANQFKDNKRGSSYNKQDQ